MGMSVEEYGMNKTPSFYYVYGLCCKSLPLIISSRSRYFLFERLFQSYCSSDNYPGRAINTLHWDYPCFGQLNKNSLLVGLLNVASTYRGIY